MAKLRFRDRSFVLAPVFAACVLLALPVDTADAAPLRAVQRGAARAARAEIARILRRDRLRDAGLRVQALSRARTVFRYVRPSRAAVEASRGIPAGVHTTSRATRGRPLSSKAAAQRFGLQLSPRERLTRETIRLGHGIKVKLGRALGGRRGVGEIRLAQPLRPDAIKRTVALP